MPSAQGQIDIQRPIAPEDGVRADVYRLIAYALSRPPTAVDLKKFASLEGGDGPFGQALRLFAEIAAASDPGTIADEYHDLFIGVGRGELVPYASYYLTGFLQEKPLARLRQDLARLGVALDPCRSDPEDHIAAILEGFAGLIDGSFGPPLALAAQQVG